ncbi:MBL fold metallo-hydrolase [Metabacillus sp. 84]|uniref:MBL fold metallo-hydrolase n=1 Tax=Metabacillus sp. 84 TaxID=3404705 RepID=UPI003CFB2FB9
MEYGKDYKHIPAVSVNSGSVEEAAPGVYCRTIQIVNVCLIQDQFATDNWVLVDAGMTGSADSIIQFTESLLPDGLLPRAILLTHGHFDHVGAIIELINHWNIPVYAHPFEIPYLTGKENYPEGSTLPKGLMAKLSPYYPNEAINLDKHVQELPLDGEVPFLKGWRWVHTPGHTKGHVSFIREEDRVLIAGDAFVTVKQESLYHVVVQDLEISGPPQYFTFHWTEAKESVSKLEELKPSAAVTGHGKPVRGAKLAGGLKDLVTNFDKAAVPSRHH